MPPSLADRFKDFITDRAFPCVGAKSALARGTLKVVPCRLLTSAWNDVQIHRELAQWSLDYRREPGLFRSLAFVFEGPDDLGEAQFERAMWERVQSLADKDAWLEQPYDGRVSSDPADPHFSLSFGGEAYFVVGLHPHATRPARRFDTPVLVFNLHDQFETLRAQERYEPIRQTILDRDLALAGSVNPMLARHGERSEASQYSGRAVSEDWRCPFRDKRSAG
ncbi:guanitoxin biosynthesis heme-dependent pre-guanitoxin N-hydroxylase GntA [Novosphingobium colocasiae]|uniref:guanitoxin biosynthesis heme-dependent pre-guanitoxin N-hydroxylase GntA n=1 Tax=Novosphingobium colocasiae TaxID=1256513 RepID=UPI0035AEBA71